MASRRRATGEGRGSTGIGNVGELARGGPIGMYPGADKGRPTPAGVEAANGDTLAGGTLTGDTLAGGTLTGDTLAGGTLTGDTLAGLTRSSSILLNCSSSAWEPFGV